LNLERSGHITFVAGATADQNIFFADRHIELHASLKLANPNADSARSCARCSTEMKGLDGSNPSLSASESGLCGFSAQSGEIARACGLICVTRGTGEKHFSTVCARDASSVS
jgi:hypothetical protein